MTPLEGTESQVRGQHPLIALRRTMTHAQRETATLARRWYPYTAAGNQDRCLHAGLKPVGSLRVTGAAASAHEHVLSLRHAGDGAGWHGQLLCTLLRLTSHLS